MKKRFAPMAAALSVFAFLAWIFSVVQNDGSTLGPTGSLQLSGSSTTDETPGFRDRTAGSAIPCAVPLAWRIARVDPAFGLSAAEARAAFDQAATLWEEAVGADLFSNEADGELSVRLVYDERQERTRQISRIEVEYNEAGAALLGRQDGLNEMSRQNAERRRQYHVERARIERHGMNVGERVEVAVTNNKHVHELAVVRHQRGPLGSQPRFILDGQCHHSDGSRCDRRGDFEGAVNTTTVRIVHSVPPVAPAEQCQGEHRAAAHHCRAAAERPRQKS